MTEPVTVVRIREFLRTDAHGDLDLAASRHALHEAARACATQGVNRVLVDVRDAHATMSATDVFSLTADLEAIGVGREIRMAVLGHPEAGFDAPAFLQLCAANRGYAVRAFHEFETAVNWLAGSAPGASGAG